MSSAMAGAVDLSGLKARAEQRSAPPARPAAVPVEDEPATAERSSVVAEGAVSA